MSNESAKDANVFLVKLNGDSVFVSVGYCEPESIEDGKARSEVVEELGRINIPIELLPNIVKKMVAVGVDYQKANKNIGFDINEVDGVETVSL